MSDEDQVELHTDSHGRIKGDDTPPQNGIIFVAAIATVVTLFSMKYAFDSYLDVTNIHVRRDHVGESHASEVLAEYRTSAAEQLRGGPMTIDEAIDQLSEHGRGGFVQIRPVADTTTGAREGWSAMPVVPGEPAPHAQPVATEAPAAPADPSDTGAP